MKLTKSMKEQIAKAALKHRFSEAVEQLVADKAALADEVYNDVYRKSDREKMAALPKGWLPEESTLGAQFGPDTSQYNWVCFNGGRLPGDLCAVRPRQDINTPIERRRVPHKHSRGAAKVYDADHKLAQKHEALQARENDLKTEVVKAKRQTWAALNSATTVNRLVEQWPEIEPFIPKVSGVPANLPALPVKQLNEMLDLPVSEAA